MRSSFTLMLSSIFFFFAPIHAQDEYYDFPFEGWNQSFVSYSWNGFQIEEGAVTLSHQGDTVLNGETYQIFYDRFYRYEDGVLYRNRYDTQNDEYLEQVLYDFSLSEGDSFTNFIYPPEDSARVFMKERKINLLGDSVWFMGLEYLEYPSNPMSKDTLYWVEGVGNIHSGLFKVSAPDGGYVHSCTHLDDFRKIYVNEQNTSYCNCRYLNGVDEDNDGYGNDVERTRTVDLGKITIYNFDLTQNFKTKGCDTLRIVRDLKSLSILVHTGPNCSGKHMDPDSSALEFYQGQYVLASYFFYSLSKINRLYITHQCVEEIAEIVIDSCNYNDCNDSHPAVHPGMAEQPYNGLDDDCDPATPDDDLDGDGYGHETDCNDQDSTVHPEAMEVVYNGVDDDCDSSTLDDDLDMDGYDHEEDCNDQDSTIHPGAIDIPDNGIDEDCDGKDSTATTSIDRIGNQLVQIYPNPSSGQLNINTPPNLDITITLTSLTGKELICRSNPEMLDLSPLSRGIYFIRLLNINTGEHQVFRIVVQ